jgi:hypothetical protein
MCIPSLARARTKGHVVERRRAVEQGTAQTVIELINTGKGESPDVGLEVSRVATGVMAVIAGLVGVWGAVCLFGALGGALGFHELAEGWLRAVTGA